MSVLVQGRVVNGRIEVEDFPLVEGEEVSVVLHREEEATLTPDEEAELDERIAEADRGEMIDGEEFHRNLRARLQG